MANLLCKLEGTWQEITARIPDFNTRKLEVIVYDAEEIPPTPAEADDPRIAIIDAIAAATREMNLAPDTRDYLREGEAEACSVMTTLISVQFVVVDASALIGLCASEPDKIRFVQSALQSYARQRAALYAPHLIVMEALYILCQKLRSGTLTLAQHSAAIASLQAALTTILPPPSGDASLIARSEALRGGYGCSHSADSMYLALAEQLSALGPTELLTFDVGLKLQAVAMASTVKVNLLVATPPTP